MLTDWTYWSSVPPPADTLVEYGEPSEGGEVAILGMTRLEDVGAKWAAGNVVWRLPEPPKKAAKK